MREMKLLAYPGKDGTDSVTIEMTMVDVRGIVEAMNRAADASLLTDGEQTIANKISAIMGDLCAMGLMQTGHA